MARSSHSLSERLLTPKEVADLLGVSPSTLKYWRHLNKGPRFIYCGKHVRHHPKDVDAYIASRESGGGR